LVTTRAVRHFKLSPLLIRILSNVSGSSNASNSYKSLMYTIKCTDSNHWFNSIVRCRCMGTCKLRRLLGYSLVSYYLTSILHYTALKYRRTIWITRVHVLTI
jgi:hypothetical protein